MTAAEKIRDFAKSEPGLTEGLGKFLDWARANSRGLLAALDTPSTVYDDQQRKFGIDRDEMCGAIAAAMGLDHD